MRQERVMTAPVLALTALGFVLGACEYVSVVILPDIAADLEVSLSAAGRLVSVPIDGVQMPRSIQIVYREDFEHAEVFSDVRRIYAMYDA